MRFFCYNVAMGLDFTNISDERGAAVYLFSDGSTPSERQINDFAAEIHTQTNNGSQVVVLDPMHGDGLRVKEFYGLTTFPAAIIIMDDDTIVQSWAGQLPQAQEISYALSRINGHMASS